MNDSEKMLQQKEQGTHIAWIFFFICIRMHGEGTEQLTSQTFL